MSKPWIVWRYGLGIFAIVVWIGGWFLTDEVHLPNAKTAADGGDDPIDEIQEEENRIWREEEDGVIDVERASKQRVADSIQDGLDESGDEFVQENAYQAIIR